MSLWHFISSWKNISEEQKFFWPSLVTRSHTSSAHRRTAIEQRLIAYFAQHNPRLQWPAKWTHLLWLSNCIPSIYSDGLFIPSWRTTGSDGARRRCWGYYPSLHHSTIRCSQWGILDTSEENFETTYSTRVNRTPTWSNIRKQNSVFVCLEWVCQEEVIISLHGLVETKFLCHIYA